VSKITGLVLDERPHIGSVTPPAAFEDRSRFGNNGTHTAITWVQLPSGLWVRSFNGTTSLITIPAAKCLSPFNKNGLWSTSAWIKPLSDGEADSGMIFSQLSGWWFGLFGEVAGTVRLASYIYHSGVDAEAYSTTTMTINAWHHVAMVYNRLATLRIELYIDGALCTLGTDTAGTGTVDDASANALILGNNGGAALTFDGSISGWRVRTLALRAGQVLTYFNAERAWYGV
jgi:hypothetical protein